MKKVFYFAAAILALAACSKEQNTPEVTPEKATKTIQITLASTKATIADNDDGAAASFAWEEGDKIGVQVGDKLVEFTLTEFEGATAKFTAKAEGELMDGAFVAYPYVPEDCVNGTFKVSFPSIYEVDKANAFRLRWAGTLAKQKDGSFKTALKHTTAIFRTTFATVPKAAQAVSMKVDESTPVTIKFTQEKTENMNFYFPVAEGSYDAITIALVNKNGDEIEGTAKTITNPNGKLKLEKGMIYRTPTISYNLYALIDDTGLLEDGDYVLAYHNGEAFNLFSFSKTMENAQAAAESIKDVHGLSNLLAHGTEFYKKVLGENYVTVSGNAGADVIDVPAASETAAMFSVTNSSQDGEKELAKGKTTLKSSIHDLRVDKVMVTMNENGSANIAAQFNAEDIVAIAKLLRGTEIPVNFQYLIDFAVEQAAKEGVTITDAEKHQLETGFEHLCRLAKDICKEKLQKDLMDINLQTNVLDVFARYYDNVCDYSLQVSEEKKFGWATPLGFYVADNGFTTNVALPNYGWFDRLNASLKGTKDKCVEYWSQFDSQYNILDIEDFFARASRRAVNELSDTTYGMLQKMAKENKFSTIGQVYKRYAERVNDDLAEVYIYKKLQ